MHEQSEVLHVLALLLHCTLDHWSHQLSTLMIKLVIQ